MKINPSKVNNLYNPALRDESAVEDKCHDSTKAEKDSMVITDAAKERSGVSGIIKQAAADIDSATPPSRLLKLKREVANGTYSVSGSDIANAMLSNTKEEDVK
ncbi:MAG: flagellar biosynthesis anti-sigma factor FlgM [Clostridiaceae bacterium]|nr:flagellar biosynthesis anti-sigma factor FlgM [Clostridiaceae bacterium]